MGVLGVDSSGTTLDHTGGEADGEVCIWVVAGLANSGDWTAMTPEDIWE